MFADLHHLSHHAAWRRQLEMLLESTGEGIYGVDLKGRCILINRAGADLLGYSPDEVLGRHMHYLIHHSYANNERMRVDDCHIYKAFQEGHGIRVDDEVLWRRDGSSFPAEYASYPIHNGNDVVGAVVTFSDISERKRTESALKFAHDELEVRVRERTAEFFVVVSGYLAVGDLYEAQRHSSRSRIRGAGERRCGNGHADTFSDAIGRGKQTVGAPQRSLFRSRHQRQRHRYSARPFPCARFDGLFSGGHNGHTAGLCDWYVTAALSGVGPLYSNPEADLAIGVDAFGAVHHPRFRHVGDIRHFYLFALADAHQHGVWCR